MTLKEFLTVCNGNDCCDNTFDYTIYFEIAEEKSDDPYDKFIDFVASHTRVIKMGRNAISNTPVLFVDFCEFINNNINAFGAFADNNCRITPTKFCQDLEEQDFVCLQILEDMANGNYSNSQYNEFLELAKK